MSERESLGGSSRDYGAMAAVPTVGFADFSPTELYNLSENIATNVNSINSGLRSVEKMMKLIGGSNDNLLLREKIHTAQQSVNACISATARDLQRLGVVVRRGDKPQKLQVERLTHAFKEALAKYSTVQKQVSEKMQAHAPRQIKANSMTAEERALADDEEASELANQQAQARLVEFETSMLLEREASVNQLAADVLDVNQIMQELADMVSAQGQTVDTVESQIEAASSNVEAGREELAKAAQHQSSRRKKMFFIILIVTVIIIILIIFLIRSFR
ncbi:Syntaxin-12 [Eumeta japonica]|uniref:Syntaxin-12 n=1 Tax=Eumeta variegata TaxID=151549 RepID=A0A4C1V663_EUMVA|nr:Syntaxin-12 [Eumeta japonica]